MRKLFAVALIAAFIATGLSMMVLYSDAAFQTITSGQIRNAGLTQFFQEVRGFKMVAATAGTATDGSTTTVTGMEVGDVIIDVIDGGTDFTTVANVDEAAYTAASGGAVIDTGVDTAPTAGGDMIFFFVDVNNTE